MGSQKDIHEMVSDFYSKAVKQEDKSSQGCCVPPTSKGAVTKLAGYSSEELQNLPAEAVVNSFGCGNPMAFMEVQPGQTVLDLGSGAGIDILLAAKKVGPEGRAIGIDMTEDMLAKAKENIAAAGLNNVEIRKGLIEKMPVEDASVDWVISNCVINLSPEKDKVFAEIQRVLKPGGHMSVSDIVVKDLPDWIRQDKALYGSCIAGAVSEEEYIAGLKKAGLTDIEVRERLHYNQAQLMGFVSSELPEKQSGCGCNCACSNETNEVERVAKAMADKVWSIKIFARKP